MSGHKQSTFAEAAVTQQQSASRWMLLLWFLFNGYHLPALADERILNFNADIQVQENGAVLVTETITVRAEGRSIRRGIYRELIRTHWTGWGGRDERTFTILQVLRNGTPEPYHTRVMRHVLRIYMGQQNRQLKPGQHTYTIQYLADWQIRHHKTLDELYWNVTGNRWDFPINKISARIRIPGSIPPDSIEVSGYSGTTGQQDQDFRAQISYGGEVTIRNTREYWRGEGLTVSVAWEAGHIARPTATQRWQKALQDNRDVVLALGALLVTLIYFLTAWLRIGRDPRAGPLVPHYEPNARYSPAAMRYIRRMGYDDKTMAAAIINLAANGHIEISEERAYSWGKPEYTLTRLNPRTREMAAGEKALYQGLLGSTKSITLEKRMASRIRRAREKHQRSLQKNYETIYFSNNYRWTCLGLILFLICMLPSALAINENNPGDGFSVVFALIWASVWGGVVYSLCITATNLWRYRSPGFASLAHALLFTAMVIPFAAGGISGLLPVVTTTSYAYCAVLLGGIVMTLGFYHWMKAPSLKGRELLDHIAGFREYLQLAEADMLKLKNPPERTPQLFERFLPYAVALDVEDAWGAAFAEALHVDEAGAYQPTWYRGGAFSAHSFGSSISSGVASSVVTSSGSSSGGGGGGSSGGGGGGGGGGGW